MTVEEDIIDQASAIYAAAVMTLDEAAADERESSMAELARPPSSAWLLGLINLASA